MTEDHDLNMTGERLVPEDIKTVEEYLGLLRHLFVYEHVKAQLKATDRVLEVGFGEGYGAGLLSTGCGHIVALDVNQAIVDYANNKYGNEQCVFQYYDGHRFPFDDSVFDAVVTFQVIEHIEDDAGFVREIHRVLKDGGLAYITTPNRETRLKPGQRPWNRFHVREYHQAHLGEVCMGSFDEVEVLGISGSDDIMQREAKRIRQGPLLRLALSMGLRKLIPESLDPVVARLAGRLRGQQKISEGDQDFRERYSVDDLFVEKHHVVGSLDLFAVCRKSRS